MGQETHATGSGRQVMWHGSPDPWNPAVMLQETHATDAGADRAQRAAATWGRWALPVK